MILDVQINSNGPELHWIFFGTFCQSRSRHQITGKSRLNYIADATHLNLWAYCDQHSEGQSPGPLKAHQVKHPLHLSMCLPQDFLQSHGNSASTEQGMWCPWTALNQRGIGTTDVVPSLMSCRGTTLSAFLRGLHWIESKFGTEVASNSLSIVCPLLPCFPRSPTCASCDLLPNELLAL